LELWQLERIRQKVGQMKGRLKVTIFAPDSSTYKVWYFPRDDVALYGRTVWDDKRKREKNDKVSPHILLDALKESHTKVDVEFKNGKKIRAWFGAEHDMLPVTRVYEYVNELK